MRPSTSVVRQRSTCPSCGATVEYREYRGIRRFRPRVKRCDNCGECFR